MTVRTAIERRDQAVAQAPASVDSNDIVRQAIGSMSDALTDLLPAGMDERRFGTLVVSACKRTPDLMQCFATKQGRTSVLLSTIQAASLALEPNTPTEECWLTPRRIKGVWECQLQVGYKGYLKLSYRSPRIASVDAEVVFEADHFLHRRGIPHDIFEHEPSTLPRSQRGPLSHAYCIVRYLSGGYKLTVFDREQVEKRRAKSDGWKADQRRTDGKTFNPWNEWEEEMWLKTVVRASRAYMDLTPQAEVVVATEGQRLDVAQGQITGTPFDTPALEAGDGEVVDVEDTPAPRLATAKQLTAVNTLLGSKLGLSGPERFPRLSDFVNRPISSTKELTAAEAGDLIDHLGAMPDVEPPAGEG